MPSWVPGLEDYLEIAARVLDVDVEALRPLPRMPLAESALHAPFASFGGEAAYPELVDQAAVLVTHLAQNHPLPDGNKRAAFVMLLRFLDANGVTWQPEDVQTDAGTVERIAASRIEHAEVIGWIEQRTRPTTR